MEKRNNAKNFICSFLAAALILLLIIGGVSVGVDSFFQFRITDNKFLLNPRFVNPGLAKSYDYNAVVIGSSMVQNFDMSILRKNGEVKPLKLTSGFMNVKEILLIHSLVRKEDTKSIVINIDAVMFNLRKEEMKYPNYLCEDGILSKLTYVYAYENCVSYLPVNIGLLTYSRATGESLPPYRVSIDEVGNSKSTSQYGADFVKNKYLSGQAVSVQETYGMEERMHKRFDDFLNELNLALNPNIEYTFTLPPYSALYWYVTKHLEYYDETKEFVRYIQSKLKEYPNARVVCYYDMDEITDLNHYEDVTHYDGAISDKMLENIYNKEYELNESNITMRIARLDSLVLAFEKQNIDWIGLN